MSQAVNQPVTATELQALPAIPERKGAGALSPGQLRSLYERSSQLSAHECRLGTCGTAVLRGYADPEACLVLEL